MKRSLLILGGGLWGGLLAYRLKSMKPDMDFVLHEMGPSLGGNHTWSFNGSDVSEDALSWLQPLVRTSWQNYDVHFPDHSREIPGTYHTISSEKFHQVIWDFLGERHLKLNSELSLEKAREEADLVIDARGLFVSGACGYQKFLGQEVELTANHGLKRPILMDATVEQIDGFRFIYYLPLDEKTVLVEDTRYSDGPSLDESQFRFEIGRAMEKRGWKVKQIVREEIGILPIPFRSIKTNDIPGVLTLSGIFHDTTGYSLPDAVRVIETLLATSFQEATLKKALAHYHEKRKTDRAYFRLLNKLMFLVGPQVKRFKVLQHFYRLPIQLIERFYRGEMKGLDRFRLFMGKPPVPLLDAILFLLFSRRERVEL